VTRVRAFIHRWKWFSVGVVVVSLGTVSLSRWESLIVLLGAMVMVGAWPRDNADDGDGDNDTREVLFGEDAHDEQR